MKNISKKNFPFLKNHPEIVYLDSAATSLKFDCVLEAENLYYTQYSTNAARGLYPLAEQTNTKVKEAREIAGTLLNAKAEEIIFTHGTTDGINMLAQSLETTLKAGKEVCVGNDAHHSLILPLTALAEKNKMKLVVLPTNEEGFIDVQEALSKINKRTSVLALTLVSNVFGVIQEFQNLIKKARALNPNIFVLIDAAQAAPHIPIDVKNLDADALLFSGHKLYGPTGIGICYLKESWQKRLKPSIFGGGMVVDTSSTPMEWQQCPEKFEAGTLPLAQIFGLAKALECIQEIGFDTIRSHEKELFSYAVQKLQNTFGKNIRILGTKNPDQKIGLLSFILDGVHPHDIATILGGKNICVRAGEHCASFLHRSLALTATTRVSFGLYTSKEDVNAFVDALTEIHVQFKKPSS